MARPLADRLIEACVAGCTCLTKTPDHDHHDEMCTYRLHMESMFALRPTPEPLPSPAFLIFYEDHVVTPEVFLGDGAEQAARTRFKQARDHWSCHLFAQIDDSTRPAQPQGSDSRGEVVRRDDVGPGGGAIARRDGETRAPEPKESVPTAWMRGHRSYLPGEPNDYDVECVYGDEPPDDSGKWIPLYRRPAQPPGALPYQAAVLQWAVDSFGSVALNRDERAARLAEEAIEVAQAEGVALPVIQRIAERVYSRPVGELGREIGGVGITVLSLAANAGRDFIADTLSEWQRVLSKPRDWWTKKHAEKVAAGTADLSPALTKCEGRS